MSDQSKSDHPSSGSSSSELLSNDLRALEAESRRGTPSIQETHQLLVRVSDSREGSWMSIVRQASSRPWWVPVGAAAAIAVAMLFIPFSFSKTVGQDVSFELAADTDRATIDEIARALTESMGAGEVRVSLGQKVVISSHLSSRSESEVRAMTAALAGSLEEEGIVTRAEVTPVTESISGTVYAFAANSFREIRVQLAGRSDLEIEQDLRSELQRIGFLNPEVEYSSEGGQTTVKFQAEQSGGGEIKAEYRQEIVDENGVPLDRDGELNLFMLDSSELQGKSDAECQRLVEEQLRARGITDAIVRVEDGRVHIERHQDQMIKK